MPELQLVPQLPPPAPELQLSYSGTRKAEGKERLEGQRTLPGDCLVTRHLFWNTQGVQRPDLPPGNR